MKLPPISIFLLVALFLVSSATHMMYESWLVKHGKLYNTLGENEKRFQIFKDNLRYIEDHNSGNHSYKLGLNKFADLTNEEYRLGYTGATPKRKSNKVTSNRYFPLSDDVLPDSVDWRTKGAVAEVKNQQQCRSDYAFSAIGAVEGINQIVTGDLITLSEQQLIDCDTSNTEGCDNGGLMTDVFKFIIGNGGIGTEDDYPYMGQKSGECMKNAKVVSIDSYKDVPKDNESELQKAVANQPIAAAMELYEMDLQFYSGGIYDGFCGSSAEAGVLVVGYGTEDGNDYWLVKNSWGLGWGEKGYIRLKRNVNEITGKCGIATLASYPIKTSQNPTNPTGKESKEHGH